MSEIRGKILELQNLLDPKDLKVKFLDNVIDWES